MTHTINRFALPIMRYGFGVLKWTKIELAKLNRKARKILTVNCFHHPESKVRRPYASRLVGGRGVSSVMDYYE